MSFTKVGGRALLRHDAGDIEQRTQTARQKWVFRRAMVEEERKDFLNDNGDAVAPSEETASLIRELAEQKAKAESNLAGWQRAQADFVNYKRRAEQEKEESIKFANANLALRILPVLDDFERAVGSLPAELSGDRWVEGVKHIERKLRTTLEAAGLSSIKAVGELFDPRLHEAVREEKGKQGLVLREAERGYRFLDRVIRASKVVVGSGDEEVQLEHESPEDADTSN
jgi:molecular chaperone GrpE